MLNLDYSITNNEFTVKFNPITRPVLPWQEEVKCAAETIRSQTTKDIIIATSGGIDAEVACRGFLAAGIPFRMLISQWADNLNEHDLVHARNFAQRYGIETITRTLDMRKFLSQDMYRYADQGYKTHMPFRYFQIYLLEEIEQLNATGIVCSGDMFLVSKGTDICVNYDQDYFLAEDWCRNNNLQHWPAFHLATPELTAAFLNHPVTQFVSSNYRYVQQKAHWVNYNPEKIIMYHSEYRDMLGRRKLMGWEKLWPEWTTEVRRLHTMFPGIRETDISLSDMRAQLGI
jgi:hypothetical protein